MIASISVDLTSLQAEAEEKAGNADPLRHLIETVGTRLEDAEVDLTQHDRAALESVLSAAVVAGDWPTEIELRGAKARSVAKANRHPMDRRPTGGAVPTVSRGELGDQFSPPSSSTGGATAAADLFESHLHYPSDSARYTYDALVGLEDVKSRLLKEVIVLTQPERMRQWSMKYHGSTELAALGAIRRGTPLLIFAGDVGTGKSALAESFGDAVARTLGEPVSLLRLSIQTRGSGIVGDMSRQISRAFRAVEGEARRTGRVTVLLVDEADALAETRETQQMHHEDRAGVNALIQGVDHLRTAGIPALVVFCSNRLDSIDPAVRRRAVDIIHFRRPGDAQRRAHLKRLLDDLNFSDAEWENLVRLTGPRDGRNYGFTYSDIADRLVRNAVLQAFPDGALTFALVERVASQTLPTRPFTDHAV